MWHRVLVVGYVGRDPETRPTLGGSVTRFSLASTRRWVNQDDQPQEETIWFSVSAFGKLGETCARYREGWPYGSGGGPPAAQRRGQPRVWTGQDGTPRAAYDVVAESVQFLDSPKEAEGI